MNGPVATAARHLIAHGVTGPDLVAALADIEAACIALFGPAVMTDLPQSYSVTRRRSAGAERQARYRARKEAEKRGQEGVTPVTRDVTSDGSDVLGVTSDGKPSQSVTGDVIRDALARTNTDSSLSSSPEPEKSVCIQGAARHKPSPVTSRITFETFMAGYPNSQGMSRLKAEAAWNALSIDDQEKAVAALPAYRLWINQQPVNYTVLHAHNYLLNRIFDNFTQAPRPDMVRPQVFVKEGAPAWEAWKRARGGRMPVNKDGGWWFPTEFPPDDGRQMNMRLLRQVS